MITIENVHFRSKQDFHLELSPIGNFKSFMSGPPVAKETLVLISTIHRGVAQLGLTISTIHRRVAQMELTISTIHRRVALKELMAWDENLNRYFSLNREADRQTVKQTDSQTHRDIFREKER